MKKLRSFDDSSSGTIYKPLKTSLLVTERYTTRQIDIRRNSKFFYNKALWYQKYKYRQVLQIYGRSVSSRRFGRGFEKPRNHTQMGLNDFTANTIELCPSSWDLDFSFEPQTSLIVSDSEKYGYHHNSNVSAHNNIRQVQHTYLTNDTRTKEIISQKLHYVIMKIYTSDCVWLLLCSLVIATLIFSQ